MDIEKYLYEYAHAREPNRALQHLWKAAELITGEDDHAAISDWVAARRDTESRAFKAFEHVLLAMGNILLMEEPNADKGTD